MTMSLLFGERSLSKVAAVFGQTGDAQNAAEHVIHDAHINSSQVKVLGPDADVDHTLEPETQGIFHTIIRAHVVLGITGLVLGFLLGYGLVLAGVPWAASNAYWTVGLATGLGLMIGLMFGGLVALRPDHDAMITKVEEAVHNGQWAVIVHSYDHDQEKRVVEVLKQSGGDVVKTL